MVNITILIISSNNIPKNGTVITTNAITNIRYYPSTNNLVPINKNTCNLNISF